MDVNDASMDTSYSGEAEVSPRKRQREGSPEPNVSAAVPERGVPWYDDGNVILVSAESRQFRVHRGVLATNSSVFKDMFRLGQPGEPGDDGCPIVQLSDKDVDLQRVLLALYNRSFFSLENPRNFYVVASLARLGKKYEIKPLHKDAITLLTRAFPMTLELFDQQVIPKERTSDNILGGGSATMMAAVNLSRELDIPFIRPAAILRCLYSHTLERLLEGTYRDDKLHVSFHPEDRKLVLLGREKLIRSFWSSFAWANNHRCQRPECVAIRRYVCQNTVEKASWGPLSSFPRRARALCPECLMEAEQIHALGRINAWQSLPETFGLPNWDELNTSRMNYVI